MGRSSVVDPQLKVWSMVGNVPHGTSIQPFFLFQPMLHNRMVHIKYIVLQELG